VKAVFEELVGLRGLGNSGGKDLVIFGGESAGGRGAMVHVDDVPEMLGQAAAFVDVVGLLDSSMWIDMPAHNATKSFADQCKGVHSYANVTHLGSECAAANPGSDAWKCIMGEYRMPHVKTPYLLVASQQDSYQLNNEHIVPVIAKMEKDSAARKYARTFANRTSTILRSLRANWPADAKMQCCGVMGLLQPCCEFVVCRVRQLPG
jgi:hypothetical protein